MEAHKVWRFFIPIGSIFRNINDFPDRGHLQQKQGVHTNVAAPNSGNDPMDAINKAVEEKGKVPYPLSLGKGQGEKAKKLI